MEALDHGTRMRLKGALTIAHAEEVKRLLLTALSGTGNVLLDAEAVMEVDLAGLQLLCAAHRTALQVGRTVIVDYAQSPLLAEALRKAGYMRHVGCMAYEEASHG